MKNLSISQRLGVSFSIVMGIFVLFAVAAFLKLQTASLASADMLRQNDTMQTANALDGHIRQNAVRTIAIGFSDGSGLGKLFGEAIQASDAKIAQSHQALLASATQSAASGTLKTFDTLFTAWTAVRNEVNGLRSEGDVGGSREVLQEKFLPLTDQLLAATQVLVQQQSDAAKDSQQQVDAAFRQLYLTGAGFLVVTLCVAVATCLALSGGISRGLHAAVTAADSIGAGDLGTPIRVTAQDEIGKILLSLENMQQNLVQVVTTVMQGADGVAHSSNEIAQGNMSLSDRTENLASTVEQTTASMEELSGAVRQNAENSLQANQLALTASTHAKEGAMAVNHMIETMQGINESSQKISDITGLIDTIAFQTNILALNAAVEAARAGEQGRGFAVVASEVRNLASKSAAAAKDIKHLVNTSVERVNIGSNLIHRVGATMEAITHSVHQFETLMKEISAASADQSSGVSQISDAIRHMDSFTQENAALVEEMASAASSLKRQSFELLESVRFFRLENGDLHPAHQAQHRLALH